MIGSGLKKLAQANGMQVARGIAYGSLQGYAATLSEGAGYKQLVLTTCFPEMSKQDALRNEVNQRNISKEFRVQNMSFAPNGINIVFLDNPGTMKKIEAFIAWFFPLLAQYGATKADICTHCGMAITNGRWVLRDGSVAFYLHDACAEAIKRSVETDNEQRKQENTGSYLGGTVGALLGALLGAVLWALVLSFGYVASIVGFVIGWLAEKGYNLLKGKQSKGKVAILIIAVIIGVVLGNFLADAYSLVTMINNGELPGYSVVDIPGIIFTLLSLDSEYLGATLANVALGLLFAALGVFSLLRKAGKEVADEKIVDLNG